MVPAATTQYRLGLGAGSPEDLDREAMQLLWCSAPATSWNGRLGFDHSVKYSLFGFEEASL